MIRARNSLVKTICLVAFALLLCGCNLSTKNQTPGRFNWSTADAAPESAMLNGHATVARILELGNDPARRFMLETKQDSSVSDVKVYINVNGTEHPMTAPSTADASHLWTFVSPDDCTISYNFFYRVTWKVPLYGSQTRSIGSAQQPLVANVRNDGQLVWWNPPNPDFLSGSGVAAFDDDSENILTLQNRSGTGWRIDKIEVDPSDADAFEFDPRNVPTLPIILRCGEKASFKVYWRARDISAGSSRDHASKLRISLSQEVDASTGQPGVIQKAWAPFATPYLIPMQGASPP